MDGRPALARLRMVDDPVADAAARLAGAVRDALREGPHRPGPAASLILSGGRTPRAVLPLLLAAPGIDWTRVMVAASDERLVPPGHPDSTEGMITAAFAAAGRPLSYCGTGPDLAPDRALAHWRHGLRAMPWPPAAAFLGMGEDGHTASLFPGRPEAADAGLIAAAVSETPPHAHARLTLGPAALAACRSIVMVVAGAAKRAVLERAMQPDADPGADPGALPVAWITRLTQTEVLCPTP